jgi:hypothetical protein
MRIARWTLVGVALCVVSAALAAGQQTWELGPSGGGGGQEFEDSEIPTADESRVTAVHVWSGGRVDSIKIVHRSLAPSARSPRFEVHGGGGGEERVFELEPGEYITAITGRYGNNVDSVVIHTSEGRQSTRFGGSGGLANFSYEAPYGYEIAGFQGRAGRYIDALGVILRPIATSGEAGRDTP